MRKYNVLVVDDDLNNIQVGINILRKNSDYNLIFATSGAQALERVREREFDLILLDIIMQPMDGFEVCKELKRSLVTAGIPIIFLTARTDTDSIIEGFELGGADYVTKPFNSHELNARVRTQLELHALHKIEIESVQREVILMLGNVSEFRHEETGRHNQRIGHFSSELARLYGLPNRDCDQIRYAAYLHDIGKIGIPDAILLNPGKLTDDEFEIVKRHTSIGYEILRGSDKPLLRTAAIIAHEHHERWNGTGYPRGLQGEEIHLYGRISAIVDVYDALLHKRVYKKAWPLDETLDYMFAQRSSQFDPELLDLFLSNVENTFKLPDGHGLIGNY